MTYDGDKASQLKVTFYVNGVSQPITFTRPELIPPSVQPVGVLCQIGTGTTEGASSRDDLRIYNRALSAQEVKDLYRYEAPERPWLTMEVETVRVTMHVTPTKNYQLEASLDLTTWTKMGVPFVANSSEVVQQFNAIEVGRFFRIYEVQ